MESNEGGAKLRGKSIDAIEAKRKTQMFGFRYPEVKSDLVDVVERNIQISNCCDPDDLRSTWPGAVHSKNQYRLRRPQAVYLHTTKYFVCSIHEALWLTH